MKHESTVEAQNCISVRLGNNLSNGLIWVFCRDDLALAQQEEINAAEEAASMDEAFACEDAAIF